MWGGGGGSILSQRRSTTGDIRQQLPLSRCLTSMRAMFSLFSASACSIGDWFACSAVMHIHTHTHVHTHVHTRTHTYTTMVSCFPLRSGSKLRNKAAAVPIQSVQGHPLLTGVLIVSLHPPLSLLHV